MLGETEKKPKHNNVGTHDGDALVCILKATKTTPRQNVIGLIIQPEFVKESVVERICTQL
jgi:hypothetical protein